MRIKNDDIICFSDMIVSSKLYILASYKFYTLLTAMKNHMNWALFIFTVNRDICISFIHQRRDILWVLRKLEESTLIVKEV